MVLRLVVAAVLSAASIVAAGVALDAASRGPLVANEKTGAPVSVRVR